MESKIKKMMAEIKLKFSNRQYQKLSNDYMFDDVPDELWKLWYSDGRGRMSISNVGYYYYLCGQGCISESEMMKMLIELRDALAHQFELLDKANIRKGERRYEGIITVLKIRLGSFFAS